MTATFGVTPGHAFSAFPPLVKFARATTLFSGISTALIAAVILGLEFSAWTRNGVWKSFSISSVLAQVQHDQDTIYFLASVHPAEPAELSVGQVIADWFFSMPAIGVLIVIAALHLLFYLCIPQLAKTISTN
jgi:hypothetical protein